MDDFRLYSFSDDFLTLLGPFDPRKPTENNQLAGPALPSQHPDIRGNEELLAEVQYYSSIHCRVGIENPPQEYSLLHDPHLVHTDSAASAAGPLDVQPCPTVPLCERLASLPNENFFFTLTLIAVGRNIREDNSGPPTFPTQISGTSNHGPMTPQAQQGESSHLNRHLKLTNILVPELEYPVTLNNDIEPETGQESKLRRCPECGKYFCSMGVRNRHRNDVHSVPQKCRYAECNAELKGKRALKRHLSLYHKGVLPN